MKKGKELFLVFESSECIGVFPSKKKALKQLFKIASLSLSQERDLKLNNKCSPENGQFPLRYSLRNVEYKRLPND